jgi:hypothetical protein
MRAARVPTVSSGAPRGLRRRTIILAALAFDVLIVIGLLAWRPEWALQGWFAVQRLQAGAEVHSVEVDGQRIVQLEAGPVDAPLVVLLHGFTGTKENWLPLMAELSATHRVIAPDLPGPSSLVFVFSPLFAVLLPAAICALAGFWMLRRAG